MNQILFVQDKRKSNPADTKKIVLFFAVTMIIFGLILFGQGVYGTYKSYADKPSKKENEDTQIELAQTEAGDVSITIESKIQIADIIYYWNSDASQTISGNGRTSIQENITMPVGQNTLTVKTIDADGNEKTKQETFTLNIDKPEIALSLVGNNIKITVNSKVDLSYITYKWNAEEEQKMDMVTYEDKTKFEKELEIPIGQNTLLVTAVDNLGNKSEKSQEIKGVTKPKSKPVIQGENIFFEVTADEKITLVEFQFNGKNYRIGPEVIGDSKRVTYRMTLVPGMNYLKIKTTTESGAIGEDLWKYEYKK